MNFNRIYLVLPIIFICGCSTMQQSDLKSVKSDVAQLEVKVNNLSNKQTDIYSKCDELLVKNETQTASVQELYKKISRLTQKIKDLESVVYNNNGGTTSKSSVPSVLYQNAYNDFLVGKYDVSLSEFKNFIKKYPNQELSSQAQYYIGECLYAKENYSDAYEEYKKVEENYKGCEYIASARLKMALCLEKLNKRSDAMLILQSIVLDYPDSNEVFTAKEKLKLYKNVNTK